MRAAELRFLRRTGLQDWRYRADSVAIQPARLLTPASPNQDLLKVSQRPLAQPSNPIEPRLLASRLMLARSLLKRYRYWLEETPAAAAPFWKD
jgi:hypothetical protein